MIACHRPKSGQNYLMTGHSLIFEPTFDFMLIDDLLISKLS